MYTSRSMGGIKCMPNYCIVISNLFFRTMYQNRRETVPNLMYTDHANTSLTASYFSLLYDQIINCMRLEKFNTNANLRYFGVDLIQYRESWCRFRNVVEKIANVFGALLNCPIKNSKASMMIPCAEATLFKQPVYRRKLHSLRGAPDENIAKY